MKSFLNVRSMIICWLLCTLKQLRSILRSSPCVGEFLWCCATHLQLCKTICFFIIKESLWIKFSFVRQVYFGQHSQCTCFIYRCHVDIKFYKCLYHEIKMITSTLIFSKSTLCAHLIYDIFKIHLPSAMLLAKWAVEVQDEK